MEPEQADRILDLIAAAFSRAPEERAAFLAQACGNDQALQAEVQSLVDYQESAREFLETPAFVVNLEQLGGSLQGELKAGDRIGDCEIIRLLGEGGMGEVYLAQDTKLERQVAVKLLKRQLDEESLLRRFRHERKVLAGLTHPNIARLYGGATSPEGRSYLVMEYVEGERLDRYCEARGLPLSERLALFRKVCAAVTFAHQNLVIHRDLKPANIRVTPEGEPKLLDFGIAKLLDSDLAQPQAEATVTKFSALTPEYASPEQLRGEVITTATDVYSLGVILYELLTGQRPYAFNHRQPEELTRAICEQIPIRPSTLVSRHTTTSGSADMRVCGEVPAKLRRLLKGDLDTIVATALRKEPARRYGSVGQYSDDIRRHCAGLPVAARKDTLGYRASKFMRRNKVSVTIGALVALALTTGLITTIRQAQAARQERDRARAAQAQAENSQQQTEHLNTFLQNLLSSADPARMGKDVKVVQVLDEASRNVDRDLAKQPELLLQVHRTLTRAYLSLLLVEPAEQQARAALALVRQIYGNSDPATAKAECSVADILEKRLRWDEADPLLRHALAIQRGQPVPDKYALANTLLMLSQTLSNRKKQGEAEQAIQESLTLIRKSRGENSAEYIVVLGAQSDLKFYEKDYQGAVEGWQQQVILCNQLFPGSTKAILPQLDICTVLFREDRLEELDAVLRRIGPEIQEKLGENSLYYGMVLERYSLLHFARADYLKALVEARLASSILGAALPHDNLDNVSLNWVIGLSLTRTGQAAAGEPILRSASVDGKQFDPSEFHYSFGSLAESLGECLLAQKRYSEAEPLLLTAYDDLNARLGTHNPTATHTARLLRELYTDWNKPAQAEHFVVQETSANPSR